MTLIASCASGVPSMVMVKLKGVAKTYGKGSVYYYAWRGGPRLRGTPGSPEFVASYNEAHSERRAPDGSKLSGVVTLYKGSEAYLSLAPSTRKQWAPWLDAITEHFGGLRVAQFDRTDRIQPAIRAWRNQWSSTPRTADYGIQVLSRVLAFAIDPLNKLAKNPCEGIKPLYKANRSAVIWTEDDLGKLEAAASPEVYRAAALARYTGLRLGDLLRLSWSHIGPDSIKLQTGKSSGKREAIIPIYSALRLLLDGIPKRTTTVLSNSNGASWTTDGFGSSFNKAKKSAGLASRDLHFHDLRGTAATTFYQAGLSKRVIAEILGWEEDHVDKIIYRYVDRHSATVAAINLLNKAEERTKNAKPYAKP